MHSRVSTMLGIGLVILWIAGLGSADSRSWLTWLDGLAALAAFSLSAFMPTYSSIRTKAGGSIALGIGLLVLWLVGITTPGPVWQAWWTFAFGCAFLLQGFALAGEKAPAAPSSQAEAEREREKM